MEQAIPKDAKFLIVDDEPANVQLLEHILEQWDCANVIGTTDPRQTVPLYSAFQPDIILLDLMMPEMDGFEVMEQLKPLLPQGSHLPILVLTADTTSSTKRKALAGGATDFLTKPFDAVELHLRIQNMLRLRFLHLQLRDQNQLLEQRVAERTEELRSALANLSVEQSHTLEAHLDTVQRLAVAGEYKDRDTAYHIERVSQFCAALGRALGLPPDDVELLKHASAMHDVGKMGIPDAILLKPGKFTPDEWTIMQQHTVIGGRILCGSPSPLLQCGEVIALSHHEKWDGSGYPNGLAGEAIPLWGRICAVADVFDALTVRRPYKPALPNETAFKIIREGNGQHFDPQMVQLFFDNLEEILAIQQRYSEDEGDGASAVAS